MRINIIIKLQKLTNEYKKNIFFAFFLTLLLSGCFDNFEIIEELKNENYILLNQDSVEVHFPRLLKNKIGIVGYIFTNCPDICPLTTNNMRLIQERLKSENIFDVNFVSISFDPEVDSPSVLKSFAEIRDLDLSNWEFLTGEKETIDKLMKKVGVVTFIGDSTTFSDGSKTYYYVHTDRIHLIDEQGRIRKKYLGSKINLDEVIADIKLFVD